MINITANAIKFTDNGNIKIILKDFDTYTISIEIIDDGCGIEEKK